MSSWQPSQFGYRLGNARLIQGHYLDGSDLWRLTWQGKTRWLPADASFDDAEKILASWGME